MDRFGGPTGSAERGHLLVNGEFRLADKIYPLPDMNIWRLADKHTHLQDEIHGFAWLDDLREEGGKPAVSLARSWLFEWVDRHSGNRKEHFSPQMAGRRIIRWLRNGRIILTMQDQSRQDAFAQALGAHADVLRRYRRSIGTGLARIELATGRVCAEVANGSGRDELTKAAVALARECRSVLSGTDGIASRNPEELFHILQNLNCAAAALHAAELVPESDHRNGMDIAGAILRSLKHSNGTMARFHGGGDIPTAISDRAVSEVGQAGSIKIRSAMGYARMLSGQTSAIIDVAAPPSHAASRNSHASTLAFEAVSGSCRLVVNRGSGQWLGPEDRLAARATDAHSAVEVNRDSSSLLETPKIWKPTGVREFAKVPGVVRISQLPGRDGLTVIASHNGYVPQFGLTHMRRLDMSRNGGRLWGEDTIWAKPGTDRQIHRKSIEEGHGNGAEVASRFHLHPDSTVRMLSGKRRVEVSLPNGEAWVFLFEGIARLEIEASKYLDELAFEARPSSQIVLRSTTRNGAAQFRWEFRRSPKGT